MNQNKICPACEADYLPHIEKCADCGAVLLLPEEYRKAQEERKRIEKKALEVEYISAEEPKAVTFDDGQPSEDVESEEETEVDI